jgi:DNA polymerase I
MIECDEKVAGKEIEIARKLMCDASETVLGAGNRLKTDVDIVRYPDRYIDEKGVETWNLIIRILTEVKQEYKSS